MGYENNLITHCFKCSEREDLNLRPPAPKAVALLINPYFMGFGGSF